MNLQNSLIMFLKEKKILVKKIIALAKPLAISYDIRGKYLGQFSIRDLLVISYRKKKSLSHLHARQVCIFNVRAYRKKNN